MQFTEKCWVQEGKVILKVPYGVFDKTLFPRPTRTFDPGRKAWVVDLNLQGKTSSGRRDIYKAASVLREYYLRFLPPEARYLLSSVLSSASKDKGYDFFFQGGKLFLDVVWGSPLWNTARRWLNRQGSGFYVEVKSERFSYFLASIPPEVKNEIANAFKKEILGQQSEKLAETEAELLHLYPYLFNFQIKGVSFLITKRWAILGDPMGLGKTLQGLCSGDYLLRKGKVKRVVVICESKKKSGWYEHLTSKRFLAKSPSEVALIEGPKKKRDSLYSKPGAKFFILNYELALRDFKEISYIAKNAFLIIDEASRLKNRSSKTHRRIRKLVPETAGMAALTGTPMENGAEDFFALAQLLNLNIRTKTWKDFLMNYCITKKFKVIGKGKTFYIDLIVGYKNLRFFRQELSPFFLRRTTKEVENLLPKIRVINMEIQLDSIQKKAENILFSYIKAFFEKEITEIGTHTAERNILARLALAKVIEDSPVLLGESTSPIATTLWELIKNRIEKGYRSPKEVALLSALFQIDTSVVIFTQFKKMAKRIFDILRLGNLRREIFIVTGESSNKQKDRIVSEFKQSRTGILVATDVLSYGENLETAGTVINFDLLWNPQKIEQRQRRIVRISSKHESVLAVNLISEGIETLVAKTLKFKLDVFSELVEGPQGIRKETSELRKALKGFILTHGIEKINFIR